MSDFDSPEELAKQVAVEGLAVVTLLQLREMLGYKKLGPRVLMDVAQGLRAEGLGYFPQYVLDDNPGSRQWDEVRVYAKNSPVGKLVDAVLEPSAKNDTYLIEASSGSDAQAAAILDQVRTLLGE